MKKFTWALLLALPLALLVADSCYYDNLEEIHPELLLTDCDTTGTISYQTDIVPIMVGSCGANNSCHNTSGAGGGFVLENYAGVKNAVESGLFISAITWDGNASQMPSGSSSKISDCYIAKISKWVASGYPNN
ncbi:MAG: hypothetical protein U0U46_08755 [Saprospiraceae bacterium]|nr:hypothetical protein [Saprospiraceae bacterium]